MDFTPKQKRQKIYDPCSAAVAAFAVAAAAAEDDDNDDDDDDDDDDNEDKENDDDEGLRYADIPVHDATTAVIEAALAAVDTGNTAVGALDD